MSRIIIFDSSYVPRPKPIVSVQDPEPITSNGHMLYFIYRQERIKQNAEEFSWSKLSIAQRLVWNRVADTIGLQVQGSGQSQDKAPDDI